MTAEPFRVVSTGYGPRYGPFSAFAPEPQPWGRGPGCTHVAPDSCKTCADKPSGRAAQSLPPCMRPGFDHAEADRQRAVWFAAQRARLGITPTPAEEAS